MTLINVESLFGVKSYVFQVILNKKPTKTVGFCGLFRKEGEGGEEI